MKRLQSRSNLTSGYLSKLKSIILMNKSGFCKYASFPKFAVVFALLYLFFIHAPAISAVEAPVVLGAHRGSSVEFPENSLEAILSALDNPKYSFIEFDVQYTKDKKLILYHDLTLQRLHGKSLLISSLTYEELQEISDYTIPTFEQVIDLIGDKKKINVEIKSQGNFEDDKEIADHIISYCEDKGILKNILISSISHDVVSYISENYDIPIGVIFLVLPATYLDSDTVVQQFYSKIRHIGADYAMVHGINTKDPLLIKSKPEDIGLVFWYYNDEMYVVDSQMW